MKTEIVIDKIEKQEINLQKVDRQTNKQRETETHTNRQIDKLSLLYLQWLIQAFPNKFISQMQSEIQFIWSTDKGIDKLYTSNLKK